MLCTVSSGYNCNKTSIPKTLKSKLQNCNFEGKLTNDSNSKVNVMACGASSDVTIMSTKVSHTQNFFDSRITHVNYGHFVQNPSDNLGISQSKMYL